MSPRRVGDVNRSRVLQALVDHGPLSRAELSRLADVTRATMGNIVQSLLDAGVLTELPPRPGPTGTPARPLWFARGGTVSVVVSLERDGCEAALVDATGELLAARTTAYSGSTAADLRRAVRRSLDAVLAERGTAEPLGIGAAVPAMCLASGEVVASSVLPALQGRWLLDLLGGYDLPAVVDTDSRAQALAEGWFGLGRGLRAFAAVRVSEGVGVGVVLAGTVFRADQGMGGEFGHTVVVQHDGLPCACGSSGCWETVAGTGWLRREARRRGVRGRVDCAALVRRAGEPAVGALLAAYADNVAVGLANLMHVHHPRLLVLNGEVRDGGEVLRAAVEEACRARVAHLVRDDVRVELSQLGERASLLGAAALVLSQRFQLAV